MNTEIKDGAPCLSFTATRTDSNNLHTVLCNVETPDRTCREGMQTN